MNKSKYLVANNRDLAWGLTVSTIGYDEVGPGDAYPTRGHAEGYYFDPKQGRELNEYQLLYLIEGEGTLTTPVTGEVELKEGDLFLLFPGVHHTYHPKDGSPWKSYWIGFKGKNMDDRVKAGFLKPEKPVYHVGYSAEIIELYESAYKTAVEEKPYSQQVLAGIVNHLIGMMYSLERNIQLGKEHLYVDLINKARQRIRESLESSLTIQELAQELGLSYSNFRKQFKLYTGLSPAMYQQDLRLQRAKELLSTTNISVKEIAYRLNFDSADYFSAKFKIKTGRKPSELRNLSSK